MAVERRERRLKGNLIPPESGVVLSTRPVEAAGCRSRATPAWPLGVTSTSRVDRRNDGSPPERRSGQGGACAAKTVMTTWCPPSAGLPRSWPESGWHPRRWARSARLTTGHDRGGGRPAGVGSPAPDRGRGTGHAHPPPAPGGLQPAPTAPIELGQHLQRLPPGRQAKAARPGSRSRRSSARSGVGRRPKAGNHLCPIQVLRLPLTMEVATWPNRPPVTPANIPCPAGRHWRTTAAWPRRCRRRAARPTDRRVDVHCGGRRLRHDQDVVADGRQQPRPASPWFRPRLCPPTRSRPPPPRWPKGGRRSNPARLDHGSRL